MNNISTEIQELKTRFETSKEKLSVEEHDKIINEVKELLKGRNFSHEIYFYCKEHHPGLIKACKYLVNRIKKKDNQICIEGRTGSGKSTLALCILYCLSHKLNQKFTYEHNALFIPKVNELSQRLFKLKEMELLLVDETIKSLNKMKYRNVDVIESNETIQTERFRHNTILYCIPSFGELTKQFREVNIQMRIWAIGTEPAAACMRAAEKHPDIIAQHGAWHIKERAKYAKNAGITPLSSTNEYLRIERRQPGYVMDFDWPDLEGLPEFAGIHLLYEMFKSRSRQVLQEQNIPQEDKAETRHKAKQKETIVKMMAKEQASGMGRFKEWWDKWGECTPLHQVTCLSYWQEAEKMHLKLETNNNIENKSYTIIKKAPLIELPS